MRILALSLFMMLGGSVLLAQQTTGSVSGTVKTSDGSPAEFVNVTLPGTSKGTVADRHGNFKINNLTPGSYTLEASFIGLEGQKQSIEIGAGQNVVVNFTLKENAAELQEVVISGTRESYKADRVSSSLRLQSSLLETPQNIQVVTGEVLKDQQAISMSDGVIRNVSGVVRSEHWGDMYANLSARGSQLSAFRNGFNIVNSYWGPLTEDMAFVDHIEFVKGPAGFMLSSGDPAGLFNVVTKKPTGITKGEVGMTMGSFGLFRTTLDLDGKLEQSGKLLYRLNLSAQNKSSFRPNEYNDRYVIAPVVSYQLDDKTKLTLEYDYQRANMSDVGSFYVFSKNGYKAYPREFTSLPPGLPGTTINDHAVYVNVQHELDENWKVTGQVARFNYIMEGSSMWPTTINQDGTYVRTVGIWDAESKMTLGQVFVNGEVNTGSVRHRVLAGLDYGRKAYRADWGQAHDLDSAEHPFDPNNPVELSLVRNGFPQFDRTTPLSVRAQAAGGVYDTRYSAAYLQDELGFMDGALRLTLALRYTDLYVVTYNGAPQTAEHLTPRVGLSASINSQLSVYAMYDQAFMPQSGVRLDGLDIKPITGSNAEFGVKKDWGAGWSSTLSVYRIMKNDELTDDPTELNSVYKIALGQKQAQGVEFDVRGSIFPGFNLTANYAYTNSKVTESFVDYVKVGDLVPGFAKHTFNAWLSYKIQGGVLKGLGVSAGGTGLLSRATYWSPAPDPEKELKDYFKFDGGLFWQKDRLRFTANVFNLLDTYLYSGSYENWIVDSNKDSSPTYSYQVEAPRNFRFGVAYSF